MMYKKMQATRPAPSKLVYQAIRLLKPLFKIDFLYQGTKLEHFFEAH